MHYHVFSLKTDILDTLVSRELLGLKKSRSPSPTAVPAPQVPSIGGTRACNVCPAIAFDGVEEQRAHFRSDWHRYNVKLRFNGGSPVTETEFAELVDELDDSISGSATSDDDDSNDSDPVSALVKKARIPTREPSPTSEPYHAPRTALAWFHSPPSTQLGVYKVLFSQQADPKSYLVELRALQEPKERRWALFMTAGGHFAGAIVRVSRGSGDAVEMTKKQIKRPKPDIEILRHKTFHRYTTRRKQGGSQSANDNAKGNAKSAGAQLRRYGEQALRDDIHMLLEDWANDIMDCEKIWIRASSSNKRIFFETDNDIITKGDERLRSFPFPTRRPTQSELSRCLLELTRVKVSHFTEDDLRLQDEAYLASLPKPKPKPTVSSSVTEDIKPKVPKLSKEEEAFREKWDRLVEMIRKGRLESLIAFWAREGSNLGGIDAPVPDFMGDNNLATLLQIAAGAGHEDVVAWLLEDAHADPTIDVPLRHTAENDNGDTEQRSEMSDVPLAPAKTSRRTAYDLAKTRSVRNVFRRCAAAHPDWWDWFGAARVPSALDQVTEERQEDKKKLRRKVLKDRVRDREAREREKEEVQPPMKEEDTEDTTQVQDDRKPRKLGGSGAGVNGLNSDFGLTPEMRLRVERERRARAAEARLELYR